MTRWEKDYRNTLRYRDYVTIGILFYNTKTKTGVVLGKNRHKIE